MLDRVGLGKHLKRKGFDSIYLLEQLRAHICENTASCDFPSGIQQQKRTFKVVVGLFQCK